MRSGSRKWGVAAVVGCAVLALGFGAQVVFAATENLRVTLPAGWKDGTATAPAVQFGENMETTEFFQLIVEAKDDFAATVDLMTYAKKAKARSAKTSQLKNRTETPLVARKVAGKDTVEYEVLGEFHDTRLHYRHIALACGKASWCQIVAWTVPSHWSESQVGFDSIVKNLH